MEPSTTESQNTKILEYLKAGYSITTMSALKKFNCFRLSARIKNLRKLDHDIITDMVDDKKSGKRYASYRLAGVEPKIEKAMPGKGIVDFSKAINQVGQSTNTINRLF
jgi:hypothetical protein